MANNQVGINRHDEIEFMQAMDTYKHANGRMFPTCSEILEVIRNLGYVKGDTTEPQLADALVPMDDATVPLRNIPCAQGAWEGLERP